MYDEDDVKRMIGKIGIEGMIQYLSGDLDKSIEINLKNLNVLVNGVPNLDLIYSLA